ncbi:hypothetical protein AX15_005339 [Amanita polypyramis BW_CC]|nr:hypothetical protein AX15_005339 [Amanita polypyramis BW_CC]
MARLMLIFPSNFLQTIQWMLTMGSRGWRSGCFNNIANGLSFRCEPVGAILHIGKCHYPDFFVTAYGQPGVYGEDEIIRLVAEVGSLGRVLKEPFRPTTPLSLCNRRNGASLGIGTEAAILQSKRNGKYSQRPRPGTAFIPIEIDAQMLFRN